ncbi:MAG: hypothetical protein ABIK31_06305 [candidate division WOR-3 bacterium]
MRHIIFYSTILLMLIFNIGCKKNRPIAGEYFGIFTYSIPQGLVKTAYIEISNPSKTSITINGFVVKKNGKKIEGKIGSVGNMTDVFINGEWSHNLFSNQYKIIGNFTETYYQGGNEYQNSGTFEIKSN